jgi:hypothetical protein
MGRHGSVRRPNPVASLPDGVATRTERTGDPPPRSTIPLATWNTPATAKAMHPSRATMARPEPGANASSTAVGDESRRPGRSLPKEDKIPAARKDSQ